MAYNNTYFDNDGKSVDVTLRYTVVAGQVAYVVENGDSLGWLGITVEGGDSGDVIALNIDQRAYQFYVPDSLSVAKGATVYIDTTDLTGHKPDDSSYSTSSGANKVALCKAIAAKDTTGGTGNHFVIGILLPEGV